MSSAPLADDAHVRFGANRTLLVSAKDQNEDTTRLRAIDVMFFDVLQWDRQKVETERYCSGEGYADYFFSSGLRYVLIVEAKRQGVTFVLPKGSKYPDEPVPFSLLAKESPDAAKAMRQAVGYAATEGARYVCISNGYQYILALAWIPDARVEDRLVFVFESLDAIEEKFRAFWQCFSPAGVGANWATTKLLAARRSSPPPKISALMKDYTAPLHDKSDLHNPLSATIQLVWETMSIVEPTTDFLQQCYIRTDASEDAMKIAKELVQNRLATDELSAATIVSAHNATSLLNLPSPEKPILVLGRIGHGKSTFLRFLRDLEAKEQLKRYIQIDIDFIDRPNKADEVAQFVFSEVDRQLNTRYQIDIREDGFTRAALYSDIKRFRKSTIGIALQDKPEFKLREAEYIESLRADTGNYLARVFGNLRSGHQRPVAIFFDNLDRQSLRIQESAFLLASQVAREWSALLFVCLRPDTFYKSREDGVLDAVAPRAIAISPPHVPVLLKRRFEFAASIAQGKQAPTELQQARAAFSADISLDLPASAELFQMLSEVFAKNRRSCNALEAAANCDMRRLLRLVQDVITSEHLDTRQSAYSGHAIDAEGFILEALIFRGRRYYDAKQSAFLNLFDIAISDPTHHFSRLAILGYLNAQGASYDGSSFSTFHEIEAFLSTAGYAHDHITDVIQELYAAKYLEHRIIDIPLDEKLGLRITPLARFHLTDILIEPVYYDAILVDTPILQDRYRNNLSELVNNGSYFSRIREFVRYLDACSEHLTLSAQRRLWDDLSKSLINRITDLENSAAL